MDRQGKRVGYRFYWADWENWPVMEKEADIPVIELAVRTDRWTMEEILASFAESISLYYLWLSNGDVTDAAPDTDEVEAVVQAYLRECDR